MIGRSSGVWCSLLTRYWGGRPWLTGFARTISALTISALTIGALVACERSPAAVPEGDGQDINQAHLLPAGMRRLTNREFARSAERLLQAPLPAAFLATFPPDVRQQHGYTRNREQTISPALAVKLATELEPAIETLLTSGDSRLFTCVTAAPSCVRAFVKSTLRRAYRRDITPKEVAAMERVFASGAQLGSARDGAVAVLSAVLQSPRLWYVTEYGQGEQASFRTTELSRPGTVRLDRYEVADQLAFVIRGQGADEVLLDDVQRMYEPEVRRAHARRLLAQPNTRDHYREFVVQWLEVDQLARTAKSSGVFEQYEAFKPRMMDETVNFADEVFVHEGASVQSLLTAGFVAVDPTMAVFYGLSQFGARVPASSHARVGVLQHASFLAAHSHADTTSPVLRGDFVLRKVLCERLPRPSELDLEIIMPRPSEALTRREQFAFHGADPNCAQCHDKIDGFGLTFERFDAAGRTRDLELQKPVRTDGEVTYGGQRVRFRDSVELSRWLARQPEVAQCFARQAFRFVTGQQHERAEDAFLAMRNELPEADRNNLLEHLVAYVASEAFVQRSLP